MKIRLVRGSLLLAESSRRRLENSSFPSLEQARVEVQHLFPNHLVFKEPGKISVVLRDRSFQVASFLEVREGPLVYRH
ncbi:MAG TPA: hypothetical protein VL126_06170 [Bacteroidota bacterium]|nr:hypothetical protein [Bacteroidota bacterium]